MNPDGSQLPFDASNPPPCDVPFALSYSTPSLRPSRPGLISATAVIGMIIAVIGLLFAAFGLLSTVSTAFLSRAMPAMRQTQGATVVNGSEAIIGALLAAMLLAGSIGLNRLRPWSRGVLIRWAWLYLLSVFVFLTLQILIVVPSQTAMVANMMATMPGTARAASPPIVPIATTMPTTAPSVVSTSSAYTVTVTSSNGATTTTTTTTMAGFPGMPAGPPQAQMAAMMSITYEIMAIGKAVICIVFPIAVLIVLQLKRVRVVLAGGLES